MMIIQLKMAAHRMLIYIHLFAPSNIYCEWRARVSNNVSLMCAKKPTVSFNFEP